MSELMILAGQEQTMALKEITDLLEVRHNDAMAVVSRMLENQEFGTATKISYQYTKGNNAIGEIETYQLNKRQSIAGNFRDSFVVTNIGYKGLTRHIAQGKINVSDIRI